MPLATEEPLRDRILAHLQVTGSDSISGVARALSAERSKPIHRLTVAGYLASMAEEGILRAVQRPPSLHYTLALPVTARDIYQRVGHMVREIPMTQEQRPPTALAALVRLFGRPVFRAELLQARIDPDSLERAHLSEEERRQIRLLCNSRRFPALDIPSGDPLYGMPLAAGPVDEVLRRALLAVADADHLARVDRKGTQTSLWTEAR